MASARAITAELNRAGITALPDEGVRAEAAVEDVIALTTDQYVIADISCKTSPDDSTKVDIRSGNDAHFRQFI